MMLSEVDVKWTSNTPLLFDKMSSVLSMSIGGTSDIRRGVFNTIHEERLFMTW